MSREKARAAARRAVVDVLREKGCVTVVDVLVAMGRLAPARVEDWRFGRVPYLERVVLGSLGHLSVIGREVRAACEAMGLEPSVTDYRSWGRGPKRPLRFSRSGEPAVERAYATLWTSEAFRRGTHQQPPKAPAPKARPPVLQPDVPIEKDPEKVRRLEAEKRDENFRLRAFLKWGEVPAPLVDRLFHRIGAEVTAEIDCASCGAVEVVHDRHVMGLFPRAAWLQGIADAGFRPAAVPFEPRPAGGGVPEVFAGVRPEDAR